jgi:hypothetical protein
MLQKFKATQTIASEMQYVLVNSLLRPLDLGGLSRKTIRPVLKARGLSWKGYYAGRRGLATKLAAKDQMAAMAMLRHASLATTQEFYIKPIAELAGPAMAELEAEYIALRDNQGIESVALPESD